MVILHALAQPSVRVLPVLPSIEANLVVLCGEGGLPAVMMCATCQPLTAKASLMRDRWHRQLTCSKGVVLKCATEKEPKVSG